MSLGLVEGRTDPWCTGKRGRWSRRDHRCQSSHLNSQQITNILQISVTELNTTQSTLHQSCVFSLPLSQKKTIVKPSDTWSGGKCSPPPHRRMDFRLRRCQHLHRSNSSTTTTRWTSCPCPGWGRYRTSRCQAWCSTLQKGNLHRKFGISDWAALRQKQINVQIRLVKPLQCDPHQLKSYSMLFLDVLSS